MSFGLNKFIKNILPKQLFYRGLLIVALPIIILQFTISIVFFDSLWIKTNKGMTRALVAEIKTFIQAYDNEESNKKFIIKLYEKNLNFKINLQKNSVLPEKLKERWFSPVDRSLRRELKSENLNYWFNTTNYKKNIHLKVAYKNGYLEFYIPRERLTSSSVRLFGLWITIPAFLIISIAIIFLKNQTRPIIKLAEASEKFGKGEDVGQFRPSGALEIRKAGYEFDRMRKRIIRHLNQRSEMLSGISHDLRTPLTRMKLQLELISDKKVSEKLGENVNEMEKMLNDYLQFASSGATEKTRDFDLTKLIKEIIKKNDTNNIRFNENNTITFSGRKNLIQRCINNFVDNSLKYAKNIVLNVGKLKNNVWITIEDDGPGIPKSEYENIFKPFYKINKGRADSKSSVGLGLSISSDIIKSHGGKIELTKSSLGGLKVMISLPS
tara:strand:+ start:646 stop:1959 length:1314 start_codon:yes stop_codon:yes gene_type:complete